MGSIHDLLYILSNAFLMPTLIGTLIAFAYATYVVGQFLAELADRRANARNLRKLYTGTPAEHAFQALSWRSYLARFARALDRHADAPAMVDKEVASIEHEMTARVDRLGIVAKAGPMLGLIGTLIPLQPALAGLARGDMQAMGANLQIGFTTTVIGLLVGGACYAVSVIYRNWFQQDVTEIHFLLAQWRPEEAGWKEQDESLELRNATAAANGAGLEEFREAIRRENRGR